MRSLCLQTLVFLSIKAIKKLRTEKPPEVPFPTVQAATWLAIVLSSAVLAVTGNTLHSLLVLLCIMFLPRGFAKRSTA